MSDRSCYTCAHLNLCRLRQDLDQAIRGNIDMIEVDVQASDKRSFVHIFKSVATTCRCYVKGPS